MRKASLTLSSLVALLAACGGIPHIVPLIRTAGPPITPTPANATPLEVVSRSTAVPDPLPVRGSDIVYGELESALGIAVSTAAVPWAEAHRDHVVARHGGWTVLVEVTGADADLEAGGRVVVGLDVRATLRTRNGNVYLGQTQLGCREGGLVSAEQGAPVVYRCMMRVGRDLAGWLGGGVRLDPPPPESG
ncbi:MAG: hypothetical protein ACLP1X_32920 [Polyangiaceae bacterium]